MAGSTKDIKRKIKSIKSTRQITKAMELVATSKMKKAVNNAVNLRSYGYLALNILAKLSKKHTKLHKFFQKREVKNVLIMLFTTDKGLCGGLNTNVLKKLVVTMNKLEPSTQFIIDEIVPQLMEMQIFQAILETTASEHSARMVAMQNATQAATDLLDGLILTYNRARQAVITQEIAEIASVSIALT